MALTHATIAGHLQSWAAFLSNEMWLDQVSQRPVADALDAILDGTPSWVTRDPLPKNVAVMDIGPLLTAAWASGNADLEALADQCEELGAAYMAKNPPY